MTFILYDFGLGRNVAPENDEPDPMQDPTAERLPALESASTVII